MTPREKRLQTCFHLTEELWEKIYQYQKGLCAMCGNELPRERALTDHRHLDGLVRGLLCFRCNKGIWLFDHSIELLRRALQYLISPPATAALGYPHFGLPGRAGTKKQRKLARKLRKEKAFLEAATAFKDTMPVLSRIVQDAYSVETISSVKN